MKITLNIQTKSPDEAIRIIKALRFIDYDVVSPKGHVDADDDDFDIEKLRLKPGIDYAEPVITKPGDEPEIDIEALRIKPEETPAPAKAKPARKKRKNAAVKRKAAPKRQRKIAEPEPAVEEDELENAVSASPGLTAPEPEPEPEPEPKPAPEAVAALDPNVVFSQLVNKDVDLAYGLLQKYDLKRFSDAKGEVFDNLLVEAAGLVRAI